MSTPRIRRSIEDIQNDYTSGQKDELEALMRAWKGIQELPPSDPRSFFVLGGYHGEPFRGAGWGSSAYWGGYCNHGNVLFPTWHRVYLFQLEEALRSIRGCESVTLPFWDETSPGSLTNGIPWALTQETFTLDGVEIPNPLRSFTLPLTIADNVDANNEYTKGKGYQTVRYPLSGLVGNETDRAATAAHNAQFQNDELNVKLLNQNIVNWLTSAIVVDGKVIPKNVHEKYVRCLDAPNYTVFSNTTSAAEWNTNLPPVVPLESPHNSIHLAVGGFDVPGQGDFSPIPGANGDMGENNTAGFDPIFFFHHCFVDRVFWLWQQRHGATDELEIIPQFPGTNSVDNQGPTPGTAPNSWLTLDSPLDPFIKNDNGTPRPYTSRDCINIETQLGYTYGEGSLQDPVAARAAAGLQAEAEVEAAAPAPVVHVSGVDRAAIRGSFLISAFATIDGKRQHLGSEAVLSRWQVTGCANCQTHLQARAAFSLRPLNVTHDTIPHIQVEVHTRDGLISGRSGSLGMAAATLGRPSFRVEIR